MLQDVVHCFLEVPQCESCGFESTSGRLETEVQDSVCFINHLSSPLRNGKGMWLPRWTSLLVVKGEATSAFDVRLFAQCTYVSKDHIYILHITYIISGVLGCWVSFNTHACPYIYIFIYIASPTAQPNAPGQLCQHQQRGSIKAGRFIQVLQQPAE